MHVQQSNSAFITLRCSDCHSAASSQLCKLECRLTLHPNGALNHGVPAEASNRDPNRILIIAKKDCAWKFAAPQADPDGQRQSLPFLQEHSRCTSGGGTTQWCTAHTLTRRSADGCGNRRQPRVDQHCRSSSRIILQNQVRDPIPP